MAQFRSFIAIELPGELRQGIVDLQARLKTPDQPWVKWVDPDSIHLTLKFLGNIDTGQKDDIIGAIAGAARAVPVFSLKTGKTGVFPGIKRVRVAWLGLDGEVDRLGRLQKQIDDGLVRLGFSPESRPFTPHLTLARVHDRASVEERQAFGHIISEASLEKDYAFTVTAVNLMKSELTRQGAVYSRVGTASLETPL